MEAVFLKLFNMSISASWLILAVFVLRLALKKAPKWQSCLLWAIVAIRLLCPISFESAFSLVPSAQVLPENVMAGNTFQVETGFSVIDKPVNEYLGKPYYEGAAASTGGGRNVMTMPACIWIVGMLILLAYCIFSFLRLHVRVGEAVRLRDNIWLCDAVKSPFILGIARPRIYLYSGISGNQIDYVLAHEQAHLKRKDHIWKPLGYLLLAVYWFNPLVWVAYILLCRDIELACDEKVIKDLDMDGKKAYSHALLSCSTQRKMVMACPLAFGEVGVKERVGMVLSYKKPALWMVAAAAAACVVVAACFLTDPKNNAYDISQNKNIITLSSGEGEGDTEVVLKPIEDPAHMKKGDWVKVGVSVQNPTDEDIDIYVQVEDVAVKIASAAIQYDERSMFMMDGMAYEGYGAPIGFNAVDSTQLQGAYVRWLKVYNSGASQRKLLDNAVMLSQKEAGLAWPDFDLYSYYETGPGLYIRAYEIDGMITVWIGGGDSENAMYFYLWLNDGTEGYIDIRNNDVVVFFS